MIDFSWNKAFKMYTVEGSKKAWINNWAKAGDTVDKRVIGWTMAYPWAIGRSAVDNVIRIPLGVIGTAGSFGIGAVGVPIWHAVEPGISGTKNIAWDGVVAPGIGAIWNTVVAPPTALVAQKPSPERVDGFWVSMISRDEALARRGLLRELNPEEIMATKASLKVLEQELAHEREANRNLQDERRAAIEAVNERFDAKAKVIKQARTEKLSSLKQHPDVQAFTRQMNANGIEAAHIRHNQRKIIKAFNQEDISPVTARQLPQTLSQMIEAAPRDKTDPLKESMDVIEEALQ